MAATGIAGRAGEAASRSGVGVHVRASAQDVVARWLARIPVVGEPRERLSVHAPFTGEVIVETPRCEAEDVAEAVRRARAAQHAWAAESPRRRARVLRRLMHLVLEHGEQAVDLIQLETGKARLAAFDEVADVAVQSSHYARRGPRLLRTQRRRPAFHLINRTRVNRVPWGVVGILSPWNYPLVMSVSESLPALLAGNGVVIKPDPQTPLSALWGMELLEEAGLPRGLYQVVTGDGPVTGSAVIDCCDYIAFTGSTETGRIVARRAAERLIASSLELGGKNALLVLDDADLDRAVGGAVRGSFASSGQLCVSVERIFAVESVYDEFLAKLTEGTRALKLGATFDYTSEMGCITSERQLTRIAAHVDDAVAKGARVVHGGRRRTDVGPLFYEPTILTGVQPGMRVYDEETFGPVISVYKVRDEDEAVARANELPYGLNASVWTRSVRRGRRVARRIEAGSVNINDVFYATWAAMDAPLGGFKQSGHGRRHGDEGLLKFTQSQTVASQHAVDLEPPAWMSPRRYVKLVGGYLRWVR